jgi:uncharacterized RDD family membrane protein YckC
VNQPAVVEGYVARPAHEGLVTRGLAFAVDAAVINGVAILVAAVAALILSVLSVPESLETALLGVAGAVFIAWSAAYFVTFWSTTGQTPGGRLLRIRVVRADGAGTMGFRRSLFRLVCLALAALPLFAGFLPILFDDRRRGLHDMLAGTVVVTAEDAPA